MEPGFKIALIVTIFVCAYCKPQSEIVIRKYDTHLREDGYDFVVETSDDSSRNENATVDSSGKLDVEGNYFIRFPETNQFIYTTYTGGVKGFLTNIAFGIRAVKSDKIPSSAIASIAGGGLG